MIILKLPDELQFIANGRKTQKRTSAKMDGKTCLISGSSSGVGLAAAKRIAKAGANLVLICRNPVKASAIKEEIGKQYGVIVDTVIADFSDFSQVRHAAFQILEKYDKIDVLVNSVGVHNNYRELNSDGIEMVFCVNHLAQFLLTRLLVDRIIESAPARILFVNSEGHRFGGLDINDLNWSKRRYSGFQSYGASKIAQLLTVWEMAEQLTETGVTVNAMHPGGVKTNIGMNNGFIYRFYQNFILSPFLSSPEISGEAIYYLVADPEMAKFSGKFFNQTIEEKAARYALDRVMGKKVWEISEKLTGLDNQEK